MPSPIRIGFIGLSSSKDGWANMAHFPYLSQSPHYAITALCNSSIESAQEAIKLHNLPPSTKAYAAPEDLAADPNVDLVVVSVKVSQHFRLVKPALLAGKDAFVEWPLGANLAEAEELLALAREKGVRCVVGLEQAVSPGARGIKKIVEEGRIGRVLSSSVWGAGMYLGEAPVSARQAYTADVRFGGNLVTINTMLGACVSLRWLSFLFFAAGSGFIIEIFLALRYSQNAVLESIFSVLGELKTFTPLVANQRPHITVLHDDGTKSSIPKTSHDQVILQGTFESGAVLSFHLRGGTPFKGTPGMTWRIYGEKGELCIESHAFGMSLGTPLKVQLHDFETGQVEELEVPNLVQEWQDGGMPPMAQMMGLVYEAFAKGEGYPDWEWAVKRHRMIEEIYARGGGESV
jgi:predicted dehydrogenase